MSRAKEGDKAIFFVRMICMGIIKGYRPGGIDETWRLRGIESKSMEEVHKLVSKGKLVIYWNVYPEIPKNYEAYYDGTEIKVPLNFKEDLIYGVYV